MHKIWPMEFCNEKVAAREKKRWVTLMALYMHCIHIHKALPICSDFAANRLHNEENVHFTEKFR